MISNILETLKLGLSTNFENFKIISLNAKLFCYFCYYFIHLYFLFTSFHYCDMKNIFPWKKKLNLTIQNKQNIKINLFIFYVLLHIALLFLLIHYSIIKITFRVKYFLPSSFYIPIF